MSGVAQKIASTCPNRAAHTEGPDGYTARVEWAYRKLKTHYQQRCPGCGLYVIWVRREQ